MGSWTQALWSALWPPRCLLCAELLTGEERGFCPPCLATLAPVAEPICRVCGRELLKGSAPEDLVCGFCRRDPPAFDRARAFGRYQGMLAESIRALKFHSVRKLAPGLAAFMLAADTALVGELALDAVIPVPLHPARIRQRGFNQAVDLARPLARRRRLPLLFSTLVRTRDTAPQYGLTFEQRRRNIRGAFAVPRPAEVAEKRLLLVDDVLTTGATIGECARVLKKAGAAEVVVLTLARAG